MAYRKKLIEVALPLEAINVASAREKSIRHGHPSTLHLWWARRPLAACRAVIFASLVDDPDSPDALPTFVEACRELPKGPNATINDTPRMRLFDFIERLVQWESTTDEAILNTARELINIATEGNPPPLLDPFAGGGSIPLEAQRLGLEAHASDLNPVAVMINKAQIEIPPRFANMPPVNPRDRERMSSSEGWKGATGLAADVRFYGELIRKLGLQRIGHLYPKGPNSETVIAWLWARTVKCPNPACGARMPLISSFELSKRSERKAWIEPIVDRTTKVVSFKIKSGNGIAPEPPKVGRGAKFRCLVCGEVAPEKHIKDEGLAKNMSAQLMAIVVDRAGVRSYTEPISEHELIANTAIPEWLPQGELAPDKRSLFTPLYGLTDFSDLFTRRQLVALTTFSSLITEIRDQIIQNALVAGLANDTLPLYKNGQGARAYAEAVSVYLAFALDKMTDTNTTICTWQNDPPRLRATFGRQAIPMTWDFAETNIFGSVAGDYALCIDSLCRVLDNFSVSQPGFVHQMDAATELTSIENLLVSTDPPYYDNIGYADLSDFFYVWLRRTLSNVYPDEFSTLLVPKSSELVALPYRFGGDKVAANNHFETGLAKTFSHIRLKASDLYPISVYYAFKQQEEDGKELKTDHVTSGKSSTGWETMLTSLVNSGFSINGTWPIRTELGTRNVASETNALASSIVLICRPRLDDAQTISRSRFIDLLRKELPSALKEMQSGNIAPVDLAQASIGPGMAVYSRYKAVLEPDGTPLSIRTALGLINQELDTYLAEQDGDIDRDTRFAVAWFEQFGFNEGKYGDAETLARAKDISVEGVADAGVVQSGRGRVKLVHWRDYDSGAYDPEIDKRATVWEATHHLIERLNSHGEEGAALLMNKMKPEITGEARNLAYRLYSICERKGWAEHARDYNTLVIQWPSIAEQAAQMRQADEANRATQQNRLFD